MIFKKKVEEKEEKKNSIKNDKIAKVIGTLKELLRQLKYYTTF